MGIYFTFKYMIYRYFFKITLPFSIILIIKGKKILFVFSEYEFFTSKPDLSDIHAKCQIWSHQEKNFIIDDIQMTSM